MTSYKVCLVLAATIIAVNANFHYEHFKTFSFQGDDGDNLRKPWFFDDHATPYRQASSDVVPNYGSPYGHTAAAVGLSGGEEGRYSNPAEALFAAATKKVPHEDKSFKKAISPFYTLTDKDDAKYKDVVLKLGVPYCTETKSKTKRSPKPGQKRYGRNAMTCYKCKDPKNGATYEQCSYSSKPQASTRVESFVPIPSSFRYRRSNIDDDDDDDDDDEVHKGAEPTGIKGQYRFGDEFFQPEASQEIPASYTKDAEKCEKVVKDSMVCMVCTDVKTNAKYEQCSYVARPNEKAYSYAKSSSFPKPTAVKPSGPKADDGRQKYEDRESEASSRPKADYGAPTSSLPSYDYSADYSREPRSSAESKKSTKTESAPRYGSGESGGAAAEGRDDKGGQAAGSESPRCKKVDRDSMTCTVCKDPKTGGNYEQCSYAYQPNDKVYQFSKSNSFGYPEGGAPGQQEHREEKSAEESAPGYQEYEGPSGSSEDYSKPATGSRYGGDAESGSRYGQAEANDDSHDYYSQPSENSRESSSDGGYEPSSSEYVKSESEKIAEETAKGGDCKKVQRDSMTCNVCKDPKTGGNSEQCSYSFEPSDKVFSFSTAKSFGSPTSSESKGDREGGEEQSPSYQVPDYSAGYDYPAQEESKPYASESQTYAATDDTERAVKPIAPFVEDGNAEAAAKRRSETDEPVAAVKPKTEFFDTSKKKAEIEKFLQDFQSEDRSKCKKIMRDKMTCYQCTDDKGFQKEECMFVAAPQPKNNRLAYHEVKEFKVDPAAATDPSKVTAEASSAKKKTIAAESDVPLEPTASASESHTRRAAPDDEETAEEEEGDGRQQRKEEGDEEGVEIKHDEPDDFATVTRPVFDKKLGLTLPAYMLVTSEHEQEFDEVVASTRS